MAPQAWRAADRDPNPPGVSCDLDKALPRDVRRLVLGFLANQEGQPVDDAVLVADELVCNAQRHGSPDPVRQRTPDRYGGRGLLLVDQMATAWGVRRYPDHKTVWAELALDSGGRSTHARHLEAVSTNDTAATPDGRRSTWHRVT
jgi:hypothetical protein